MQMVNEQNFNKSSETWRNMYISMVMVGQLTLGETAKDVFDFSTVKGQITTTKEVHLSPFEMQAVPGISKVAGHVKGVHMIAEPRDQGLSNEVVAISVCGDLKPSSSRVKICLQNLTSKKIVIPTHCVMGQVRQQMRFLKYMHWLHQRGT